MPESTLTPVAGGTAPRATQVATELTHLPQIAQRVRADVLAMAVHAGGAHVSPAFSIVDLLVVLYERHLAVAPELAADPARDRLVLSKGHGCAALYAVLARRGFFPRKELKTFCRIGSTLGGHPDVNKVPGVEASTGSLGHGFAMAVGMALGLRREGHASRVVTIVGDGECQEGSVWESALAGAQLGLDNLLVIVDANGLQGMGSVETINSLEPFAGKWQSFGWHVQEIDGHDLPAIDGAIERAFASPDAAGRPSVIVARTVKGKGVSYMEGAAIWHYRLPDDEEMSQACKELGVHDIHEVLP